MRAGARRHATAPLRALTLDYWDTIYHGAVLPERVALRRAALRRLVDDVAGDGGTSIADERFRAAYDASGEAMERWWHEQRGYRGAERIAWALARLDLAPRPAGCPLVARALVAVDDALLAHPPRPLAGAVDAVRRLAARCPLAIVSDTGFASGEAQDRLLAHDGLLDCFAVRVYSCDVGHAKPHHEPFARAAASLGTAPASILHVGDIERTDVAGALAAGFRAVRIDAVRNGGTSAAEAVVGGWAELEEHLDAHGG